MPGLQRAPFSAWPGQASTHRRQDPQKLLRIGVSGGSGASVRSVERRTALPNSFVTSRQLFPIHPSPARVAAVLCGSGEVRFLSSDTESVVMPYAWNPCSVRNPVPFVTMSLSCPFSA